ncbi:MAG: YcaO-like family protein [Proteobacteria bacterium]|nr:YcaO-like family protein [Pseudomonadota bacterium]
MERQHHDELTLFDTSYSSCLANANHSHYLPEDLALTTVWNEGKKIGITRVADVTGYDRVGIPVFNSIKPTTSGSSVQHGKGVTKTSSKISALMESFERYHSMNAKIESFEASYDEVAQEMPVVPFDKMPHINGSFLTRTMPILWTTGWDIANNVKTAAPLAMVELAGKKSQDKTFKTGHLQVSSNGLSAGFHILEAVIQGLLEVIERDGITCHTYKSGSKNLIVPEKTIDFASIPYPEVSELHELFIKAGITPFLYDCSTDIGIPVYNCFLFDDLNPDYMYVHGMGAGLHPRDAMVRALTESAQSRVVFNAGSRDLYFQEEFETSCLNSSKSLLPMAQNQKKYRFDAKNDIDVMPDFVKQITYCIHKLRSVGLDQALVFPLVPESNTIQVVRVAVPGAEGYIVSSFNPGNRALDYLKGVKQ